MDELNQIRETYNRIALDYHKKRLDPQSASWNDNLESPAMNSILQPMVNGKKVLDLGCGTGLLTNQIRRWGGQVSGVDISEEMIRIAQQNYQSIDFRVCDSGKLPFEGNHYDVVASSLVMHYIRDLKPGFAEVSRVLKEGGHFVFSMHHPMNESIDLKRLRQKGIAVLQPYFNDKPYYWRMCGTELLSFHHTFEDIVRALKSTGFVLLDMIECRPDSSVRDEFKDYELTSQYPTFCLFHAKAQGRSQSGRNTA